MQCVFPVKPILVNRPLPSHRLPIWSVLITDAESRIVLPKPDWLPGRKWRGSIGWWLFSNTDTGLIQLLWGGTTTLQLRAQLYLCILTLIPNPKDGVYNWAYVLLQVHEQAHLSRPLTKPHVSSEDVVGKRYDKLTGAFSFATGPEKGLCFMPAAFYRGSWKGSHTLPSSEGDEVQHDPARRTDSGGEENSCSNHGAWLLPTSCFHGGVVAVAGMPTKVVPDKGPEHLECSASQHQLLHYVGPA